ncbi:MAG: hypothetical protein HOG05_07575 [Bacteroidetes bacterium]|mgnify:FL=1|nr:hypothetical protein [Bacteroidota bacterium]MBT3423614.1 hypothetical protein [Bacteroidota bacterium]MBT3800995.1 hypothetical protein [Bacteroidota bacterium]MBT3933380.1 hypothetical protein [Bacteroidota bacterium]MBT4728379.1 hypothetical protein [Bacteroidota bacterium]
MKKIRNILTNGYKLIKAYFLLSMLLIALFIFVSFAEKSANQQQCTEVVIRIYPENNNQFLDKQDVINSLVESNGRAIENLNIGEINTKDLESTLKLNSFIDNAEVYFDLLGNLYVDVYHRKPVLRIMSSSDQNYYIDKHGVHMPLSKKHTARILIATGFIEKASRDTDFEQQLFAVAEFIKKDQFLDALIGQIHVKYDGELILVPKIEDFKIEFGNLDNMEFKFKKLKIFYKEILPYEGWNKYNKVDLRFSNQIVLNKK